MGFDCVKQSCGIRSQITPGHSGKAHLFLTLRANQRRDNLLPFDGNPHGVGAKDQQAGTLRLWLGKVPRGIPTCQLHVAQFPEVAIRRVVISSANITISRFLASDAAARVATALAVDE